MLTVYGIETMPNRVVDLHIPVATVLTVYGIETSPLDTLLYPVLELQQCLPFTVLNLIGRANNGILSKSCNSAYRLRY